MARSRVRVSREREQVRVRGEREQLGHRGVLIHRGVSRRHGDSGGCGGDERVGDLLGRYREGTTIFQKTPCLFFLFCFIRRFGNLVEGPKHFQKL